MRTTSAWLLVSAWIISAVGCAASRPATPISMTCQFLRMASANPTERVTLPSVGFSLLPPQGDRWCVGASGPRETTFMSSPLLGKLLDKRPSEAEIRHSIALVVVADEVPKDSRIETEADMIAFIEQRFLGKRPGSRFALVESKFVPDSSLGAECIRFDAVVEERDNPDARGLVLIGVFRDNFLCRHPKTRTPTLVLVSTSERYVQGTITTAPLLIDSLRSEWEPSVRSLQFMPSS